MYKRSELTEVILGSLYEAIEALEMATSTGFNEATDPVVIQLGKYKALLHKMEKEELDVQFRSRTL